MYPDAEEVYEGSTQWSVLLSEPVRAWGEPVSLSQVWYGYARAVQSHDSEVIFYYDHVLHDMLRSMYMLGNLWQNCEDMKVEKKYHGNVLYGSNIKEHKWRKMY